MTDTICANCGCCPRCGAMAYSPTQVKHDVLCPVIAEGHETGSVVTDTDEAVKCARAALLDYNIEHWAVCGRAGCVDDCPLRLQAVEFESVIRRTDAARIEVLEAALRRIADGAIEKPYRMRDVARTALGAAKETQP